MTPEEGNLMPPKPEECKNIKPTCSDPQGSGGQEDREDRKDQKERKHQEDDNMGVGGGHDISLSEGEKKGCVSYIKDELSFRLLDQVLESLPYPALVLDRQHIVRAWNHAMEALTHVPREDILNTQNHWARLL